MARKPGSSLVPGLIVCSLIAGCTSAGTLAGGDASDTPSGASASAAAKAAATPTAFLTGPTCTGTNAHDKHAFSTLGCELCHPCGGQYVIANTTISLGFQVSGTITHSTATSPATCTASCHNMNGGNLPVYWNAQGPLACSSCHLEGSPQAGTPRSSHFTATSDAVSNRAACQTCHITSAHLSGSVVITGPAGPVTVDPTKPDQVNAVCLDCHDGTGRVLVGQTPPVLPSYTSLTGDFHGARAGTGFGGTLKAPFVRGQAALACEACHSPHSSTNSFLFASTVNGSAVAPAAIDRAGQGAAALCTSCHQPLPGNGFHQGCQTSNCHTADPINSEVDPNTGLKRPGACFFCHGHEGITNFSMPTWDNHPNNAGQFCSHCHQPGWFPTSVTTAAPAITALAVDPSTLTSTSATVTWSTSVPASSWVEWGTTDQPNSQGAALLVTAHSVTLTGLAAGATYSFKARSVDALRNVGESAVKTFTTALPGTPLPPKPLSPIPDVFPFAYMEVSTDYTPVTFTWAAAKSPLGNAVQYQFQLADSNAFAALRYDTGWTSALSFATPNPGLPSATNTPNDYFWRVRARDAVTGATSVWAAPVELYIYNIYTY
jgi:predicted CXXCH cytochrome family protein